MVGSQYNDILIGDSNINGLVAGSIGNKILVPGGGLTDSLYCTTSTGVDTIIVDYTQLGLNISYFNPAQDFVYFMNARKFSDLVITDQVGLVQVTVKGFTTIIDLLGLNKSLISSANF